MEEEKLNKILASLQTQNDRLLVICQYLNKMEHLLSTLQKVLDKELVEKELEDNTYDCTVLLEAGSLPHHDY